MPQGNLNNLLGAARDFRNFQQEPEQIRMAKQDQKTTQRSKEMAVKLQEAGIDNELRAMKQKGELEVLYKWQAKCPIWKFTGTKRSSRVSICSEPFASRATGICKPQESNPIS